MNEPIKFLEVLIARGQLHHNDNPVLSWMADSAVSVRDGNDNVKFDKESSADKIDGLVSMTMSLAGAMRDFAPEPSISF